jgi:DNA (cytosine-5)-methyltransferase 1
MRVCSRITVILDTSAEGAMEQLTSVELCAGAGGQALGLEQAGFAHQGLVELDADACQTLRRNRAIRWTVIQADLAELGGRAFGHVDLLAGGLPCPPFSVAGKQLGQHDERDLFPQALRLAEQISPRTVLLENVPGLAARRFDGYRAQILRRLHGLGYETWWQLVQASQHGVPQLRSRFVLVAIKPPWAGRFSWPATLSAPPLTVGEVLGDLMGARGWPGAAAWAARAQQIAPTIVGGSTKHGGPDLGPTRARQAWKALGVDGRGIADHAPGLGHPAGQPPRLTITMVARLQGFPDSWEFCDRKTAAYRQVGNAFPPPVAAALGAAIATALLGGSIDVTRALEIRGVPVHAQTAIDWVAKGLLDPSELAAARIVIYP